MLLDDALRTGAMTNSRQLSPTAGAALVYYTHDAWDRLVKVTVGADVRAEHEYNGLNWRTVKRVDTDANTTLDQRRVMYYDQSWRIVQEDIADGFNVSSATDRIRQHVWGLRYIDDLVHSRENNNFGNDFFGPSYERRHYHLTDAMYSSVAVVDSAGALLERVAYTPYGRARHSWATDVDGDGAGGQTSDNSAVTAALTKGIHQAGYNVDADVNRDGVVNSTDGTLVSGGTAAALAEGAISAPGGVDSVVGYDGYVFNAEAALYTVRHRTLAPEMGRWLSRDPSGFVDGMQLQLYALGAPTIRLDPLGLETIQRCGQRQTTGQPEPESGSNSFCRAQATTFYAWCCRISPCTTASNRKRNSCFNRVNTFLTMCENMNPGLGANDALPICGWRASRTHGLTDCLAMCLDDCSSSQAARCQNYCTTFRFPTPSDALPFPNPFDPAGILADALTEFYDELYEALKEACTGEEPGPPTDTEQVPGCGGNP